MLAIGIFLHRISLQAQDEQDMESFIDMVRQIQHMYIARLPKSHFNCLVHGVPCTECAGQL